MENLKKLRKSRKLYQKDIAEYLGVAISTVSAWENDVYEIDFNNLKKLAEFFDVSIDELLERNTGLFDNTRIESESPISITVGNKLQEIRTKCELSQEYVASKIGITQQRYSRYERGEREADYATLCRLADFFEVSVDELLGRTTSPQLFDDARVQKTHIQEMYDQLNDVGKARALGYIESLLEEKEYLLIRKVN